MVIDTCTVFFVLFFLIAKCETQSHGCVFQSKSAYLIKSYVCYISTNRLRTLAIHR